MRIRRRLDQAIGRQHAEVYVDGEYAGTWYHADSNPHLRWFDSDFDIHPKFTHGKRNLNMKLLPKVDDVRGKFTDFNYKIYCLICENMNSRAPVKAIADDS